MSPCSKIQKVWQLEIIVVCLATLFTLPGTLIAQATLLVLTTLITLALARLPLSSALDAATLSGRFSVLFATLTLLVLSLLALGARFGSRTRGFSLS